METLLWIAGIYVFIGFLKAEKHINSGKVGLRGKMVTFTTVMLL